MKTSRLQMKGLLASAALCLLSTAGVADFKVQNVVARRVADRLIVDALLDLTLTEETERAVNQGVPLVVLTEFAVIDQHWLWEHRQVRHATRSRLRYQALTDHYIVDVGGVDGIEAFRSLADALEHIGTLKALVLDWPSFTRGAARRGEIEVRSRLDVNALPAPLRPTAYLSRDWQLGSGWTRWEVER